MMQFKLCVSVHSWVSSINSNGLLRSTCSQPEGARDVAADSNKLKAPQAGRQGSSFIEKCSDLVHSVLQSVFEECGIKCLTNVYEPMSMSMTMSILT